MSVLTTLFPDCEAVTRPEQKVPLPWCSLLELGAEECRSEITSRLGIAASSASALIRSAVEIAVLRSRRKRDRTDQRLLRLAVVLSGRAVLLFSPPVDAPSVETVPPEFTVAVSQLGLLQFGQRGGKLLNPASIPNIRNSIRQSDAGDTDLEGDIEPFFDHCTGDYDGWSHDLSTPIWTFDHETARWSRFALSWGTWFEMRIGEAL